jgi:hypothetical protein
MIVVLQIDHETRRSRILLVAFFEFAHADRVNESATAVFTERRIQIVVKKEKNKGAEVGIRVRVPAVLLNMQLQACVIFSTNTKRKVVFNPRMYGTMKVVNFKMLCAHVHTYVWCI